MSDEEYEYDYGSDAEYDYGSDQGSGDGMADEAIEIENSFYEADDYRTENPAKAIELFERVIELETAQGDEVKWYSTSQATRRKSCNTLLGDSKRYNIL